MAKIKVLVADDEFVFRECIGNFLKDDGFDVSTAKSEEELLSGADGKDVLVVDVRLPTEQLEGIRAVAKLLQSEKLGSGVAIIFVSVMGQKDDLCQRKLQQLHVPSDRYDWLQKPFEIELLANTIRKVLNKGS